MRFPPPGSLCQWVRVFGLPLFEVRYDDMIGPLSVKLRMQPNDVFIVISRAKKGTRNQMPCMIVMLPNGSIAGMGYKLFDDGHAIVLEKPQGNL